MAELNLSKYGITGVTEIVHNPSYELLFEEETKAGLEGYEVGKETELGAVNVKTGIYTGRSPKDKYIVMDENSKDTVWWTSDEYKNDNHPMSEDVWATVKDLAKKELSNKRLFVVDAFCGANHDTRMAVRFIVEVAWQAHFVTNMFIQPTAEELENFEPDFVVYNASKAKVTNYKELGLNSETCVAFNTTSKEQVIINKGLFVSMAGYLVINGVMNCFALFRLIADPCLATVLTFIGAVSFFASDSILFYVRFKKNGFFKTHFMVMLTYLLAEFLIVEGFLLAL